MPDPEPNHVDAAIATLKPLIGAKARVVLSGTISEVKASIDGALATIQIGDEAVKRVLGVGALQVPLRFMKIDQPAPVSEPAGE